MEDGICEVEQRSTATNTAVRRAHDLYTVGERKRAVVLKLLCTSLSKIWAENLN